MRSPAYTPHAAAASYVWVRRPLTFGLRRAGPNGGTNRPEEPSMNIASIMTTNVQVIDRSQPLQVAAQLMDQLGVGSLPVCDGPRLVGMVTDRDIAIRGTAAGLLPAQARVSEVMTDEVLCCREDQDAAEVMQLMGDAQLRRLPVVNPERELIGIVSLGDLATRQPTSVHAVLREISSPSEPDGGPENA